MKFPCAILANFDILFNLNFFLTGDLFSLKKMRLRVVRAGERVS